MTDSDELIRLRARVAELEVQLNQGAAVAGRDEPTDEAGRSGRPRAAAAAVLLTLACVLAPLSVVSVWASTYMSDTDQYVETVAPLADDPAVQASVADAVTVAILDRLDVEALSEDTLNALADQPRMPERVADVLPALSVPLANGVSGFVGDQVDTIIRSDQFATVWAQANAVAHEQLVKLLSGNAGGVVTAEDGAVSLQLGPIIAQVKDRLVARGFALADNIPEIDRSFVLVQSDAITRAQGIYRLMDALGTWLPLVTLSLFVAGIALARGRRRALMRGAIGIAASMVVLGALLAVARIYYLNALPLEVLDEESAGSVFDTLVGFLRTSLRATAVLALVVAFGAFVVGSSPAADSVRAQAARFIGLAGRGADAAGLQPGPVSSWVRAHKRPLELGLVAAGALSLAFWDRPSAGDVIVIALLVLLGVGVVELMARPAAHAPAGSAGGREPVVIPPQPGPPVADTLAASTSPPVAPSATSAPR
jgi:hypothetical protein